MLGKIDMKEHGDKIRHAIERLSSAIEKSEKFIRREARKIIAEYIVGTSHEIFALNLMVEGKTEGPGSLQSSDKNLKEECFFTFLADMENEKLVLAGVKRLDLSSILVEASDGHMVLIELNDGKFKTHLYNDVSDGPVSIWSMPGRKPFVTIEEWEGERHDDAPLHVADDECTKIHDAKPTQRQ